MGMDKEFKLQIINAKRSLAFLLLKKGVENLTPSESNTLSHLMNDRDIQDILDKAVDAERLASLIRIKLSKESE